MTIALVFLVLALVCFVLAAANVSLPANLTALGLAFMVLAQLVGSAAIR